MGGGHEQFGQTRVGEEVSYVGGKEMLEVKEDVKKKKTYTRYRVAPR